MLVMFTSTPIFSSSYTKALAFGFGKKQQQLEERVAALEEQCKQREGRRVDLELQHTAVKENLKKSLAGGPSLGLAVTSKTDSVTSTGKKQQQLEERVAALEEQCKQREGRRVDLELQHTAVKENLKKSLAGGPSLGLAVTSKTDSVHLEPGGNLILTRNSWLMTEIFYWRIIIKDYVKHI
ncbi:hypothetical protein NDU88_002665 [Pleurodeles waltl]|uniref:Uncharacterized protein n=1 Tax=Pleurodeles waltl TaxID=8319 RepID=A0AAV7NE91_PLEWA|nr:hypothetical protein NDU88_002665 [Pleurodeles waltl]